MSQSTPSGPANAIAVPEGTTAHGVQPLYSDPARQSYVSARTHATLPRPAICRYFRALWRSCNTTGFQKIWKTAYSRPIQVPVQYAFAIGSSSAGKCVMTRQPLSVTTTSSSMRAAEKPSLAGQ